MSEQHSQPDPTRTEKEIDWSEITSGKPDPQRLSRQNGQPGRVVRFLPAIIVLLFVVATVWLAWPTLSSHLSVVDPQPARPVIRPLTGADESCKKVTQLLRDLPSTEEAIKLISSQIRDETRRIEEFVADFESGKQEWGGLALVYGELKKARVGLPSRLEPFTKRDVVVPVQDPQSDSLSTKHSDGIEFGSDPTGLLEAVAQYDAACWKLLGQHGKDAGDGGVTWGK